MFKALKKIFSSKDEVTLASLKDTRANIVAIGDRIVKIFCGKNNIGSDLIDVRKRIASLDKKEKIRKYDNGNPISSDYKIVSKYLRDNNRGKPDYKYISMLLAPIDNLLKSNYEELTTDGATNTLRMLKDACLVISKISKSDIFNKEMKQYFTELYNKLPDSIVKVSDTSKRIRLIKKEADEVITELFEAYNKKKENLGEIVQNIKDRISKGYEFNSQRIMPTKKMMYTSTESEDLAGFFTAFLTGIIYSIKDEDVQKIYKEKIKKKLNSEGVIHNIR